MTLLGRLVSIYNAPRRSLSAGEPPPSDVPELVEIADRAQVPTDISDHLRTLFIESLKSSPRLIVELGVRGGESTFVFERVAKLTGARLVSVDIEECISASSFEGWTFVQQDDVGFGLDFPDWCKRNGLEPEIDVLFIDTSHLYDHTVQEIEIWFPHLSEHGKVLFHDTNMRLLGRRLDGTLVRGWDNQRGVIRAIEGYLGVSLPERKNFDTVVSGWWIKHHAHSNGLTIMEKLPEIAG